MLVVLTAPPRAPPLHLPCGRPIVVTSRYFAHEPTHSPSYRVKVCVVEHDEWSVAAKLERQPLHR